MDFKEELTALLSAQVPLLHLVTYEEERVLRTLGDIDIAKGLGLATWDMAAGFHIVRAGKQPLPVKDCTSDTVLAHLAANLPPIYSVSAALR